LGQQSLVCSVINKIVACIGEGLEEEYSLLRRLIVKSLEMQDIENYTPWKTIEWQRAKDIIGRIIANCICKLTGCKVYRLEMHGGEPSPDLGDKDVDLAIECEKYIFNVDKLEEKVEEKITSFISSIIGDDVHEKLKLSNIVEMHYSNEFLIERYIRSGPPLAFRIC
jgi:hypothetical protein